MPNDQAELLLPSTRGNLLARWQVWPSDDLQFAGKAHWEMCLMA